MAEYTPGHVDAIADRLHNAPANSMIGTHVTLGVSDAASAVRMLRAYAATLRQQAGRVDVDRGALQMALNVLRRAGKDEVADELEKASDPAALAQNTQGETVAWGVCNKDGELWVWDAGIATIRKDDAEDFVSWANEPEREQRFRDEAPFRLVPLYLHAGRAKVPDGMVLVPREPTQEMLDACRTETWVGGHYATLAYKAMLAAAASQRAEVK